MNLTEIKLNNKAIVTQLRCRQGAKRRLMDIGLTKGVEIKLMGKAPLGDPLLINLRGFALAIRKEDAKDIVVEG